MLLLCSTVDVGRCSTMYMLIHGFQTCDIHSIHSYNLSISDRFQSGTCHLAGRLEIVRYSRVQGGSSHSQSEIFRRACCENPYWLPVPSFSLRCKNTQRRIPKYPQSILNHMLDIVGLSHIVLNLTLPGSWFWVPWGMPWCISRGHDFTKTRWLHGGLALPGGDCMICMDNREGWLILHYIALVDEKHEMHLTTYNYHSISYHLKMSLVIFEYIWYISNHTCVWHCHWADMFARQCWSGETSLGRIIADQWSRMRITFDRRMFQCDRLQSQRTLDQRRFVLWRMWLRTVTVSICQHVGLKFSACSRAVPRNLLSWDTEKCAPCFLFSHGWWTGELSWAVLHCSYHWQDLGKLNRYFEILEAPYHSKAIASFYSQAKDVGLIWRDHIMHGEFGIGMDLPFCRLTCAPLNLGDLFTGEEMLKEEIYDEEVGAWERLQPKVRVSATLIFVIGLIRFPMSIIEWNFEVSCIHMGMDQYLLIPFLVGWTSIYQLFWCSPGVQGFDTLPHECSQS